MKMISAWAPLAQQDLFRCTILSQKFCTTLRECRIPYWGKKYIFHRINNSWPVRCTRKKKQDKNGKAGAPNCIELASLCARLLPRPTLVTPTTISVAILLCAGSSTGMLMEGLCHGSTALPPSPCRESVLPNLLVTAPAIIWCYAHLNWQQRGKCLQPAWNEWMQSEGVRVFFF